MCLDLAHRAGIADDSILLDPGIGFGKTVSQNLELLNRLDEIRALGYPLLLGVSRKSFIGYTLNLPPDQRAEGTAAAAAVGIIRGADIIRVHDVLINVRVARMVDAIVRGIGKPGLLMTTPLFRSLIFLAFFLLGIGLSACAQSTPSPLPRLPASPPPRPPHLSPLNLLNSPPALPPSHPSTLPDAHPWPHPRRRRP